MNYPPNYAMSVHVVEHLVLGLILPALFVLTARPKVLRQKPQIPLPAPVSWIVGVGAMIACHLPGHRFHLSQPWIFLITGTIFWWPILGPRDRPLPALGTVAYLFSACLSCTLLGAYLTFSSGASSDQQLAGLLMWVPGCFVYLSAILVTVKRWYSSETTA